MNKKKNIYTLGIILILSASYFASDLFGSMLDPNFNHYNYTKVDLKFYSSVLVATLGGILTMKGYGYWPKTADSREKIRILILWVILLAMASYFILPILAIFFPLTLVVGFICLLRSRKW